METRARQIHPYHQVDNSPWPIQMSFVVLGFALSLVNMLVNKASEQTIPTLGMIGIISIFWWRDVIREAKGGYHTIKVQKGQLIGFLLFLLTEIMQFVSFFWAFFHSSLAPAIDLGSTWPPIGISAVNTWAIPLQGSCVLLASGFILTLGHHAAIGGNKDLSIISVFFTVILGILFLFLQGMEYYWGEFCIADSVYGTVFYSTTSQHGLHVIIGVIFLFISQIRLYLDSYTTNHHIGFEFAIFYWHLVDVVWQFVFVVYYWWGS